MKAEALVRRCCWQSAAAAATPPACNLRRRAEETDAAAVVMAKHNKGALREFFVGGWLGPVGGWGPSPPAAG